jgi:hypothetical protein
MELEDFGCKMTPVDPFRFDRLYGGEKYNLQHMLLKAVNLPDTTYPDDKVWENYEDRIPYEKYREAVEIVKSDMTADAFFAGATDESLLAFGSKLAGFDATGVGVVRYTNVSSGYPCLLFIVVKESKFAQPRKRYGPTYPKPSPRYDRRFRHNMLWGLDAIGDVDEESY